jgi:hypothetical protein
MRTRLASAAYDVLDCGSHRMMLSLVTTIHIAALYETQRGSQS